MNLTMKKRTNNHNYHFNYRIRAKNGLDWGDWHRSSGEWQGVEVMQRHVRMFAQSYKSKEIEIEVILNGQRIDFNGQPTDTTIMI